MSFARHQSFYIRANWFLKATEQLRENPKLFSRKDSASLLGMGKNMVESLRFWLVASGLASSGKDGVRLTTLGKIVEEFDPFFEDDMTWLLIHYGLTSDLESATSWHLLFNRYRYPQFTEGEFVDFIKKEYGDDVSPSSIKRDYDCLLATYVQDQSIDATPEDSVTCPLRKYGLIERIDRGVYRKAPPTASLAPELLYFVIRTSPLKGRYYGIKDLVDEEGSIGRVFNLSVDHVYLYLQRLEDVGLAKYSTTAGVNSVTFEDREPISVLRDYYRRVRLP